MENSELVSLTDLGSLIVCWVLAMVFGFSSYHKLAQWKRFIASFSAYEILPKIFPMQLGGLVIVTSEIIVTVALLAMQRWGLLLALILLALYMLAMAINLMRGRTYIDCGCGDEPTPVSVYTLMRNLVLMTVAFLATEHTYALFLLPWDAYFFAVISASIVYGVYLICEQILANRARHLRLWQANSE